MKHWEWKLRRKGAFKPRDCRHCRKHRKGRPHYTRGCCFAYCELNPAVLLRLQWRARGWFEET